MRISTALKFPDLAFVDSMQPLFTVFVAAFDLDPNHPTLNPLPLPSPHPLEQIRLALAWLE